MTRSGLQKRSAIAEAALAVFGIIVRLAALRCRHARLRVADVEQGGGEGVRKGKGKAGFVKVVVAPVRPLMSQALRS
jgi:hypothetical protein